MAGGSVSYSQSTAERLMKVFREYGSKLLDASDSNSESAPVRILTYSQAVILLGVPEEGREQFILDMDITWLAPSLQALAEALVALMREESIQLKVSDSIKLSANIRLFSGTCRAGWHSKEMMLSRLITWRENAHDLSEVFGNEGDEQGGV